MTAHTIRTAAATDLSRIKEIAVAAEMFSAEEAGFFDEMIHGAIDGTLDGHHWLVVEDGGGRVISAAQFAPEPFADRMWNLSTSSLSTRRNRGVESEPQSWLMSKLN